jgi:glycosyltransferase involved in cell wall biosynthesis
MCDLAVAHLVRTGQYLDDCTSVPTVLEMTDALSLNYRRVIETGTWGWKNLIYRFEQPRVQAYERKAAQRFDLVSLVSPVDRRSVLRGQNGSADHVSVYTNGIDLSARPYSKPNPESPPVLVFIGNMRTVHNQDACEYFAAEVLPLVREQLPGAVFRIIGSAPESTVSSLQKYDGVEVTGWVDSIPSAVQGALCGIGVMRLGAGLQNKVLEYMALGLPVVANRRGLEGIDARSSEHVLLGHTPRELTDQIVRLYRDADHREGVACRAREFVEAHHQWTAALEPLAEDVSSLLPRC